jgi:hypothetical protein
MSQLTGFEIVRRNGDYLMHFNMENGETVEVVANYAQLDLIAEDIDRHLDRDEEPALTVDDADTADEGGNG